MIGTYSEQGLHNERSICRFLQAFEVPCDLKVAQCLVDVFFGGRRPDSVVKRAFAFFPLGEKAKGTELKAGHRCHVDVSTEYTFKPNFSIHETLQSVARGARWFGGQGQSWG